MPLRNDSQDLSSNPEACHLHHAECQARSSRGPGEQGLPFIFLPLGQLLGPMCTVSSSHLAGHPVHTIPFRTAALIQACLYGQCTRSAPGIKRSCLCPLCWAVRDRASPGLLYRCDREGPRAHRQVACSLLPTQKVRRASSGCRSGVLASTKVPAGQRGTCACSPGHGSTSCFPSLS